MMGTEVYFRRGVRIAHPAMAALAKSRALHNIF